jgi:hypothetical protein
VERDARNIRLVKHYPEQKFKARNSKFETNPNDQKSRNFQPRASDSIFGFWAAFVSDFELRISDLFTGGLARGISKSDSF